LASIDLRLGWKVRSHAATGRSIWNQRLAPTVVFSGLIEDLAMKSQYLVAALFAVSGVAIGVGASSIRSGGEYCPNPSAASVTALFAPCQTFGSAMGREVSKQEAFKWVC
jgi:hypothetical protein